MTRRLFDLPLHYTIVEVVSGLLLNDEYYVCKLKVLKTLNNEHEITVIFNKSSDISRN